MDFRRIALLACMIGGPASAADQWVRLATPHFELYTTAGEKKGREAILYFEQVRSFFFETNPSKRAPDFPVRIIAFRGEKPYKPYRINEFAAAFYTGNHERDYIVMQDIQTEHYPVAIHEYTHLIVRHTGLKLPLWFNEGWADLYSSLKPMGSRAMIGDLLPGRVQTLFTSKWIPLQVLTSVNHDSAFYNERERAGIFYAESWALTHMLFLGSRYRPHFQQFVAAMSGGKTMQEACDQALGVPMPEVEKDLQAYLKGNRLFGALFDVKLEKSAEEATASQPGAFETDMMLADLLAVTHKTERAKEAYQKLAQENPGKPEVEESLGYLAWQSDDRTGALNHFEKAFAAGTQNPQMCFHYGLLAAQSGSREQGVAALKRAVELKPDYRDARLQLGTILLNASDYAGALAALRNVKQVDGEQAQWFFNALAFAHLKTGDRQNARLNAELAKKWAKRPEDVERAVSMLRYLDESDKAPQVTVADDLSRPNLLLRVEGEAKNLECLGKSARFTVRTTGGEMRFEILDPAQITIRNSAEVVREFICGLQAGYRVVVEYSKADQAGIAGIVRTLEF